MIYAEFVKKLFDWALAGSSIFPVKLVLATTPDVSEEAWTYPDGLS